MVPKNETNEFRNEYFDFSGRIGGTTYFLRAYLQIFFSMSQGSYVVLDGS